jgi:flagellar protein FlaJ
VVVKRLKSLFGNSDSATETGPASDRAAPTPVDRTEQEIERRIEDFRAHETGLGRVTRHPLKVIFASPINILLVSAPIAVLFFILGAGMMVQSYGIYVILTSTALDDIIVFTILIMVVPLTITDLIETRRVRLLEEALPNFFRDLAGMNDSGMTLPNAVHLVALGDYSTLTPHIKKMDNEMSWNVPFVDAILRFGQNLGTPLALRSVDLVAKASKAGGDASEVLRAAAVDTYETMNMKSERRNNMIIYVIIVLISFFVFLFVIFVLVSTFLTTMATAGAAAAAAGASGQFGKSLDISLYTRIFSHAAMIQGFCSGLVAGQMGESSAVSGLKYSVIMLAIAWVMFRFFV